MTLSPHEERFVETALEDHFGGRATVDLTGPLRWSIEAGRRRQANLSLVRDARRPRRWAWTAAGVAAGIAAGLAAACLLRAWSSDSVATRSVPVELVRGAVHWTAAGQVRRALETGVYTLRLAPGDHLDSRAGAQLRLADLGTLVLHPDTRLRIETMEWKQFSGGAALGAIGFFVLSGGAGILGGDASHTAGPGERLAAVPRTAPGITPGPTDLQRRLAAAEAENERLRRGAQAAAPPTPARTPDAAPRKPARFPDPDLGARLDHVDWNAAGVALAEVLTFAEEASKQLAEIDELPLDVMARFRKLQGDLLLELSKVIDHEDPRSFSHPTLAANLLAGLLEGAGAALDGLQTEGLGRIAAHYVAADKRQRETYGADVPELERLLDDVALKDRFYAEALNQLTPAQRALVSRSGLRGVTGLDPFSAGAMLSGATRLVEYSDHAELAAAVTGGLERSLTLDAAQRTQARALVDAWLQGLPADDLATRRTGLTRLHALPAARVRSLARAQLALLAQLGQGLALRPEQRTALRGLRVIPVPVRR